MDLMIYTTHSGLGNIDMNTHYSQITSSSGGETEEP